MTLKTIQETFEKVKNIEDINDLYEMKLSVNAQLSEVHRKLHEGSKDSGNSIIPEMNRTDILGLINQANTLVEYINERIGIVRNLDYEKAKTKRVERAQNRDNNNLDQIEKQKFFLAAKKMLSGDMFRSILAIAQEKNQKEIQEMLK